MMKSNSSLPQSDEESGRFEIVSCLSCGETSNRDFIFAQDDLTGKPGKFRFVKCSSCGLAYQSPRLRLDPIKEFYDNEYIAHRRKTNGGWLAPLLSWVLDGVERRKERLTRRYAQIRTATEVLDVGCGAGGFLQRLRERHGAKTTGLDFKDLSGHPSLVGSRFYCGIFYEQNFNGKRFDLITMWHFLEHDYDPAQSLATAGELLADDGRLIIEVPRLDSRTAAWFGDRWPGLQAPQHTILFDREHLEKMAKSAGLQVVEYLPYGAFPAYYYLFTGVAFKLLRGRGLNVRRALLPYFLGQVLLFPVMLFERKLNLAMQTIVCRKAS
ncbi:MAG TPA: hypothetical protein DIS80_01795 [Verrucomicrobiales bacterium]|nr:hypothetical protein [Verrucomicrobiales bacterium]